MKKSIEVLEVIRAITLIMETVSSSEKSVNFHSV
jgi:hypothetical protein